MVTTFNARLIHLANSCTPIVGQKRKLSSDSSNNQNPRLPETLSVVKRSSGYYYAQTHSDAQSNKRRRQKEELQYTAATIQSALSNAGRPPMSVTARNRRERALPFGCVDMQSAKMVTSAEFDENQADHDEARESNEEQHEEEYNVSSMYMLSSLIQSTRHYYSYSSDSDGTSATTVNVNYDNNRHPSQETTANLTQVCNNSNDSEDNSEALSSWTPSCRSYNDLMDENCRKDIDNDNRSDGQSSDMGAGESISSFGSSPQPRQPNNGVDIRKESYLRIDAPFSIVG